MEQVKTTPSEKEIKAIKGFKEIIIDKAKEIFLSEKEMAPIIFIGQDMPDGRIAFIGMDAGPYMGNNDSKEELSRLMKKVCKAEPLCIILATEAWAVKPDKDKVEEAMKVAPSQHPDKIEILMFSFESENVNKICTYEIIRDGEQVSLGKLDEQDADNSRGRFTGMLKDMKKVKWN